MSKRWDIEDDEFLAAYFDTFGDYIGTHDLGRPKGAAAKRAAKLKECGAWDVLKLRRELSAADRVALGLPFFDEERRDDASRALAHCRAFFGNHIAIVVPAKTERAGVPL